MKNLLRTLFVLIVVLTVSESEIWGQTYTMKKPVGEDLNKELIQCGKWLFEPAGTLEYSISTNDLVGSYDAMKAAINYDLAYKDLQEKELRTKPKNSILWNNLGNYYTSIQDKENARKNFQKAYDFMDFTFSKDSSYYYSFKGLLELNLGMEGGLANLEHAIQIDPNDSIAITFLPITLLNSGEFDKVKEYCNAAIDRSENNNQGTWYVFYIMADLFQQFGALQQLESGSEEMRNKEYDEVLDMSRINTIYEKYKTNQSVANAKLMSDILAFYFKLLAFEFKDGKFKLKYTKKETLRLHEIESSFLAMKDKSMINEFSRIKNLAYLYFLQGKTEQSKEYFEKAITLFPEGKNNDYFSPINCYSALFCFSALDKDIPAMKRELERMMKLDEARGPNMTRLCDMAKCALQEDNYEQLSEWLDKAFLASNTDFETLRLLIHYYYFYRVDRSAVEEYYKTLVPLISTEFQNYNVYMELVLFCLADGNATSAHKYIEEARNIYAGEPCERCDELEKKYIKVSK